MGELERIESIYGCVAEYNRCRWERENEYEPTEEEIAENERQMAEYYAEIQRLNGKESMYVHNLVAKWEMSKPKYDEWNLEAYYRVRDWSKARCLDIVEKIAEYYGVEVDEEWATFYRTPEGKFAISVEYCDGCYLKNKHIGNLDLETFKNVFRDLHYAKLSPTMSYNRNYVSNVSLGHLLRNYIREV